MIGTSCGEVSTPRSPRATMIASATAMMPSMCRNASGFSILAMIGSLRPCAVSISSISSLTSAASRTKDSAT